MSPQHYDTYETRLGDLAVPKGQIGKESGYSPLVSIIVPLKNEREGVESCMKSLLDLDYQRNELLIIDTGSTDGTYQTVQEIAKRNPKIRVLRAIGNAATGRNLGLKEAKGEIAAFIDGDCIARPDWLTNLVRRLTSEPGTTAGVGGPNIPVSKRENMMSRAVNAVLNTFLGSAGSVQVRIGKDTYVRALSTANSAFRIEEVRTIGGFDSRLQLCEDSDFCRRLTKNGSKLRFVRDATVYHEREYYSLRKFGQHMFRYGRGRGEAMVVKPRTNTSVTSIILISSIALMALLLSLSAAGNRIASWLFIATVGMYLLTVVAYSLAISKGLIRMFWTTMGAFLALHVSYTAGVLSGMISSVGRALLKRRPTR